MRKVTTHMNVICNRVHDPSMSFKVVDFGTNRKHACDFLKVHIATFLSSPVSEILKLLYAESHFPFFHIPGQNFGTMDP